MRRYLFLLLLVSSMSTNAQTFDEANLVGKWLTPGLAYDPYKIVNIESITLGEGLYGDETEPLRASGVVNMTYIYLRHGSNEERTITEEIPDYYISNNNKLHIWIGDGYALHFIIEELTASTLKVKTYDGQSYLFTKDNSSTSIRALSQMRSTDETTYHLSGQKAKNVTDDGIYIQNGQKKVVKR